MMLKQIVLAFCADLIFRGSSALGSFFAWWAVLFVWILVVFVCTHWRLFA